MVRTIFFVSSVLVPAALGVAGWFWPEALWASVVVAPLWLLGWYDVLQRQHALRRIYPVVAHGRYLMEAIRPEIQQYFVESNTNGAPFSREQRSVVYQRAKGMLDTMPFGTQNDVYVEDYEWMNHSIHPLPAPQEPPRIRVGGAECKQPYDASMLNISAMSYGSLSRNAILALNKGAKLGGFAHNTGEGGLSPYHLEPGGDVIWQIGTGYFGCRGKDGGFDAERFKENAARPAVKMIEIKISQGAKPGHGGILPAAKVTKEIATIRGVPMGKDVISPPGHSTFSTPRGLLEFVVRLRELSFGKPVGFKLCVGYQAELLGICKAMVDTKILPDFITVDGGEGGTGAAPIELSDSVGMPLRDGLVFTHNALMGVGLRKKLRLLASGKIVTGFDMFRAMALGAEMCNAARAMMFALGCIQARRCNDNTCPVGVATQDPSRWSHLDVDSKSARVARYHHETVKAFCELYSSAALDHPSKISARHVMHRVDALTVKRLWDIYPFLEEGALLGPKVPETWHDWWDRASAEHFA